MKYTETEKTTIRRAARALFENARDMVEELDGYLDRFGYTDVVVAEYVGDVLDDMADPLGGTFDLLSFDMACYAMAAAVDLLYQ